VGSLEVLSSAWRAVCRARVKLLMSAVEMCLDVYQSSYWCLVEQEHEVNKNVRCARLFPDDNDRDSSRFCSLQTPKHNVNYIVHVCARCSFSNATSYYVCPAAAYRAHEPHVLRFVFGPLNFAQRMTLGSLEIGQESFCPLLPHAQPRYQDPRS